MIKSKRRENKMPTNKQIIAEIERADSKLGSAKMPYTLSIRYYK